MADKIRITPQDLADPHVDEVIGREQAIRTVAANMRRVGPLRRFLFSSMFYMAIAGAAGAFIGWGLIEPYYKDRVTISGTVEKAVSPTVLAGCTKCGRIYPVDPDHVASEKCQKDGTSLKALTEFPAKEAFKLAKTTVFILPRQTKIVDGRTGKPTTSTDDIAAGQKVRIRGEIVGPSLLLALKVEVDPAFTGPEPGEPDLTAIEGTTDLLGRVWFGLIGGLIGLMIGGIEGLFSLNLRQALVCGGIGLGVGAAGGLAGDLPAEFFYGMTSRLVRRLAGGGGTMSDMHGAALMVQIVGRSIAWGVIGLALALGQGIARKSKKLVINGLIGGCMGGLFGGMLFDPIARLTGEEGVELSRCVGFVTIGLFVGVCIGLVEQLSKEAWLLMRTGPLAGKQFVVHKAVTSIGSAAVCDIYLFRDASVRPEHARLTRFGRNFEIQELPVAGGAGGAAGGTGVPPVTGDHGQDAHATGGAGSVLVNGEPAQRRILRDGDVISIGSTQLEYRSRGV